MPPRTPALMIQGAGSNVGKSLLAAGLCRALARRGLTVRPFKPQNMSNNAAVTADGGEIGRAQALQARACGIEPLVDMNPVLLKPETDFGAQVVVRGRRLTTVTARDYAALKPTLTTAVLESFEQICEGADVVIVEGAGSPAEVNLRAGDIANMGFAEISGVPVILVGDIDRGGVIAQLAGTRAVLSPNDASRIKGFIINKFRGDITLFDEGLRIITERTGWPSLGVAPWFAEAHRLPAEDAADIRAPRVGGAFRIAVPMLSRIANFDDLDPLKLEPGASVIMVPPGAAMPGDADLAILPGTKSTIGDLAYLRAQGWDVDLRAHVRRGGRVLGLCGGYQMMGRCIVDAEGVEGPPGEVEGLGLLDVETVMTSEKHLARVRGRHLASGEAVSGYEIHIGRTDGPDRARPLLRIGDDGGGGRDEGATSPDGRAMGAYVHGLFAEDGFRRAFLRALGAAPGDLGYDAAVDQTLDRLADHVEAHLDVDMALAIARTRV